MVTKIENMPGRNRPELSCDRLGYPASVGDEEWETKHKKNYTQNSDGTWSRKD